jgi:DNA replication protein DnaC
MITKYDQTTPIRKFHSGFTIFFKIESHDERKKLLCEISLMMRKVSIDILALDDWLIEKHGESENESMGEVITKHYGKEACDFVKSFLNESMKEILGDYY